MSFNDDVIADINNVYMNVDEFGSPHSIEGGEPIICVFDDEALRERLSGQDIGVAQATILLFAKTAALPPKKPVGSHFNIDGAEYLIDDWSEDMGVSQIALHKVTSL
ncbi:MAG: hypothetical protein IJ681_00445 [Bacteroidales bacterium]|nr:hypothetical protein [Bacteroidales bacterium]